MKIVQIVFLMLLCIFNNKPDKAIKQPIKIVAVKQQFNFSEDRDNDPKFDIEKVDGAIGILTTSDSYKFGDTINVYKSNGKLLTVLKKSEEYQVIALRCLGITGQYYQILLENGSKGLVFRHSKKLKFQTWEEHLLSLFSVEFDNQKNPLKGKPSSSSSVIYFDKDEFYHPNKIEGEWLQVEWGSENDWKYGWIKWKYKGRLIIKFYYFA